jgi:hypothetical protein
VRKAAPTELNCSAAAGQTKGGGRNGHARHAHFKHIATPASLQLLDSVARYKFFVEQNRYVFAGDMVAAALKQPLSYGVRCVPSAARCGSLLPHK